MQLSIYAILPQPAAGASTFNQDRAANTLGQFIAEDHQGQPPCSRYNSITCPVFWWPHTLARGPRVCVRMKQVVKI